MVIERQSSLAVPHEIHAVIPRAEIRSWRYRDGKLIEANELILNSVTIAHSPMHPEQEHTSMTWEQLKPEDSSKSPMSTWKYIKKPGT